MLEIGKEYTYKQLCESLNLTPKGGNAKQKQLKELTNIYNYTKNGTKYLINSINNNNNNNIEVIDKRSITLDNIRHILITTLSNLNDENTYFCTNKDLLRLFYMINNNYYSIINNNYNTLVVGEHFNFDDSFLQYVDLTYEILKPTLKSALKSMESHKEILVNKGYKIWKNINGVKTLTQCVVATDELGKELFKIQGDAMKELGIKNESELFGKKIYLKQDYYNLCNKKASETLGIDGFYQCYAIILNTSKMTWDLEQERSILNDKIYDKVHLSKVLHDLSYNQIDKWFTVLNTSDGDKEYKIMDFVKMINSKKENKHETNN